MDTRRAFLLSTAAALVAPAAYADDAPCTVFIKERQTAVAPGVALQSLKNGNARFVAGRSIHCDLMAQVRATASGQAPFAAVVGCIDSRAPRSSYSTNSSGYLRRADRGNFINTESLAASNSRPG